MSKPPGPKEAALRAQREARVAANKRLIDTELISAKPKRSAATQKRIKDDIEAAAKRKPKKGRQTP